MDMGRGVGPRSGRGCVLITTRDGGTRRETFVMTDSGPRDSRHPQEPERLPRAPVAPLDRNELARHQPACPVCGGALEEIRSKLQCSRCHQIWETCCEGDRG